MQPSNWWESKQRRPSQARRKQYKPRATSSNFYYLKCKWQKDSETCSATSDEENEMVLLDDWDDWMNDSSVQPITFFSILMMNS